MARCRDSNGLSSEGELRIFDKAIKKDDEFTHDGDGSEKGVRF